MHTKIKTKTNNTPPKNPSKPENFKQQKETPLSQQRLESKLCTAGYRNESIQDGRVQTACYHSTFLPAPS